MINLYEYQKRYLADLPARAIMAADTGTGKTFMSLAHYEKHNATPFGEPAFSAPLLILAPASKVRTKDWEREIEEYFGDRQPEYEIYSYEKFSRDPELWQKYWPKRGGIQAAIICDEVHKIKNPQSKMGKVIFNIAKDASFFVGLSATPLPNGWIDAANYFKIFGVVKHITHFKQRYCNIQTYKGWPEIVNYEHESELASYWQKMSKKLDKKDANDLPARTFVGANFKRPAAYTKLLKERITPDGELLDTAPKLAHAIRQTLTPVKLDYLSDLLDGTDENVVIFYNYISEREAALALISKKHKHKKVFRQDGEKHELPSKSDWAGIHNSITLAQYKSGSTGVEMTYATQVVYLSPTYSYADYLQSIGRVYRNGQEAKTTFYNLRTVGTIEADIYETLRGKNDFQLKQWVKDLEEEF